MIPWAGSLDSLTWDYSHVHSHLLGGSSRWLYSHFWLLVLLAVSWDALPLFHVVSHPLLI